MAKSNTNTTESIKKSQITQSDLDREIREAGRTIGKSKKVKVKIPAYLKNRLGTNMPVGINGAIIYVPVDGETHEVPEPFAAIINDTLENLTI